MPRTRNVKSLSSVCAGVCISCMNRATYALSHSTWWCVRVKKHWNEIKIENTAEWMWGAFRWYVCAAYCIPNSDDVTRNVDVRSRFRSNSCTSQSKHGMVDVYNVRGHTSTRRTTIHDGKFKWVFVVSVRWWRDSLELNGRAIFRHASRVKMTIPHVFWVYIPLNGDGDILVCFANKCCSFCCCCNYRWRAQVKTSHFYSSVRPVSYMNWNMNATIATAIATAAVSLSSVIYFVVVFFFCVNTSADVCQHSTSKNNAVEIYPSKLREKRRITYAWHGRRRPNITILWNVSGSSLIRFLAFFAPLFACRSASRQRINAFDCNARSPDDPQPLIIIIIITFKCENTVNVKFILGGNGHKTQAQN